VPPVTFVGIGVGNRPNGGIASRLDGLVIPFFDFTFNGAAPTDTGFRSIDIARQYDGLADTPQFVTNPVALANAVLGVLFTHAFYGEEVSLDPSSPKYVQGTVEQQRGNTTYYWIPTADLPLFDPLRLLGVPEGVLDIAEPFVKTLVEAGYDRSVPFGQPTPAQLIPVIDPVTFGLQLTGAVLEGADNAAKLVGGALPGYAELSSAVQELEKVSAEAIGRPYGDVVRSINNAFNPIVAFNRIEGPIVTAIDSVVNATGLPRLLNQAIGSVLFPLTAWAERNVLFPESDTAGGPLAAAARQALEPVLPHLADKRAAPEQAQALEPVLPQRAIAHKWDAHRSDGTKRDDQRDDQKKDSDADEVSPAKKPLTNDGKPARKPGHQPHADKPRRADKPRPRHEKRDADDHKRSESGVSSG
jgi:hypothetical protein